MQKQGNSQLNSWVLLRGTAEKKVLFLVKHTSLVWSRWKKWTLWCLFFFFLVIQNITTPTSTTHTESLANYIRTCEMTTQY